MTDIRERLIRCFEIVFPDVAAPDIPGVTMDSLDAWDSLAMVTLVAVIEEEFVVEFPLDAIGSMTSFESMFAMLVDLAGNPR